MSPNTDWIPRSAIEDQARPGDEGARDRELCCDRRKVTAAGGRHVLQHWKQGEFHPNDAAHAPAAKPVSGSRARSAGKGRHGTSANRRDALMRRQVVQYPVSQVMRPARIGCSRSPQQACLPTVAAKDALTHPLPPRLTRRSAWLAP
jgi:hypothetical protein